MTPMDPGKTLSTTLVSDPEPDTLRWLQGGDATPLDAALARER